MLKYKINIADALERKGFNTYKAKISKLLSQDTLKKIKHEDTNISLESINRICMILDMQPKDLIEYVENEEEKKKYNFWNYFENISLQSDKSMILYNCQEENQMTITRKGERRANGSHERERNQNRKELNNLRNPAGICQWRKRGLQERGNPWNARQNRIGERARVTRKSEKGGRHTGRPIQRDYSRLDIINQIDVLSELKKGIFHISP